MKRIHILPFEIYSELIESKSLYNENEFEVIEYKTRPTDEDRTKFLSIVDDVYRIINDAYEPLGGYSGFQSISELKRKCIELKVVYYQNEIVTVAVYRKGRNDNGIKCVGIAAVVGKYHREGVFGVKVILNLDAINFEEYHWLEASGVIEKYCREVGCFNVPNNYFKIYMPNTMEVKLSKDGYHYERYIKGVMQVKTLFGFDTKENCIEILRGVMKKPEQFI